ncbi:general stress protein 24 [Streptococcus pneumoniae]|nr:general stress protein 24 [Streptococcus pneumoniae]
MSNEKNTNTNVEKKDATVVAHEIKGELTYEDKVIQKIIGLSLENVYVDFNNFQVSHFSNF